jgi:hypothetical protein
MPIFDIDSPVFILEIDSSTMIDQSIELISYLRIELSMSKIMKETCKSKYSF